MAGMRIEPEISGLSIALLGQFNPAIFTPAWFALHELLPTNVAENAELRITHPQMSEFSIDWLFLQVKPERFLVDTSQAPHVRLRDLVVRVFKEKLHHTPITAFGINRNVHFRVRNLDVRDRIGRMLAPVEPWGAWGKSLGESGRQGGMTSLTMTQIAVEERPADDRINVAVQPSVRIGDATTGVFVQVNDHYTAGQTDGRDSATPLMDMLEKNFEDSIRFSEGIIDQVMSLAQDQES